MFIVSSPVAPPPPPGNVPPPPPPPMEMPTSPVPPTLPMENSAPAKPDARSALMESIRGGANLKVNNISTYCKMLLVLL